MIAAAVLRAVTEWRRLSGIDEELPAFVFDELMRTGLFALTEEQSHGRHRRVRGNSVNGL